MERKSKLTRGMLILIVIATAAFMAGMLWSARTAKAAEKKEPRVVYKKKTELDFEGLSLEGELKNPAEFYFKHRPEEKFDSLVKRRRNFNREMLRDSVLTR